MSRTAAIISTKYPYPTDDGKKKVLAGFLAYLLERFGKDNVTYIVLGRQGDAAASDPLCATVWVDPPAWTAQGWNLLKSLSGIESKSMQEAVTFSSRVKRRLDALVATLDPEILILDTLRIGQYFWSPEPTGARRILYMDDLFSLRFRRMNDVSATDEAVRFDASGTFSPMLPGLARAVIQFGSVQKFLYRLEAAKMDRRERDCTGRFDRCLLINPNEARSLTDQCPGKPVFPVSPLLFPEPCRVRRDFSGAPSFLLFGSLRHPVYRASVIRFLERGLEGVIRLIPDARVSIVGEGGGEEMARLCSRFGHNVELRGFVDDLDAVFSTTCALLVPLLAAGGLKLKVLTALYYGLPIVATDCSVDGIPLEDGVHFIRENDIERYPIHMARLRDVSYNFQVSRNASALFREHYSKESVCKEYDGLLGPAGASSPTTPGGPGRAPGALPPSNPKIASPNH